MSAAAPEHADAHARPPASPRSYVVVWATLLALTAVTTSVSFVDLGVWNTPIGLAIAFTKATLIVLFFMHVREGGRLVWATVLTALLFFGIMMAHTFADYWSRGLDHRIRDPSNPAGRR
jgi:cytochrome c oxidase subunit 4